MQWYRIVEYWEYMQTDNLNRDNDIFGFIKTQEANYKRAVPVGTKEWSMKEHIERSTLYRDSDIVGTKTKFTPIKNITRPILNLQYRTEDIDVKDVQIYVDDKEKYHLSFLVKKYHDDVFTQMYDLDTFFDRLNQSRIDYGAGLSKRLSTGREVVPLQSIAFCDQTDMLSGPIGIKHYYSPDQLLDMEKVGWGKESNGATVTLKQLITLSREEKKNNNTEQSTAFTPGRYIEIYEIHGNLPKRYADRLDDSGDYETRLFIVAFYAKSSSTDGHQGVILYTAPEAENPFKLAQRGIGTFGRALDFGGAEEIADDQLWTNYAQMRKLQMMDSASVTVLGATGPTSTLIAAKNNINDLKNNEILDLGEGDLKQIDTFPRNFKLFDNFVGELQMHAKEMGAAQDPLQGNEPTAGTPFASLQAQIQQGMGLHDYRRGIFAKHIEEIYKDDYIPIIIREITKGHTFLSELSLEELQWVVDRTIECELEKAKKEYVLNNMGQAMTPDMEQTFTEQMKASLAKKGNKQFVEILKGEFKGITLNVKVSVAGKSKNLGKAMDVIVNLFRFAAANPQGFMATMQIPGMAASFNQILEYAGLSQVDFSNMSKALQTMQQTQPPQAQPQPPQSPQTQPQQPVPSEVAQPAYA